MAPQDLQFAVLEQTLITLYDSAAGDYHPDSILRYLADQASTIFDGAAVGVLFRDQPEGWRILASSSQQAGVLEMLEISTGEGPCLEAANTGEIVSAESRAEMHERWPTFEAQSRRLGYKSVFAVPLQLSETEFGSMNIFCTSDGALDNEGQETARMLATFAALGLRNYRELEELNAATRTLQVELDEMVVIAQATGVLIAQLNVSAGVARQLLDSHATASSEVLVSVARRVVSHDLLLN